MPAKNVCWVTIQSCNLGVIMVVPGFIFLYLIHYVFQLSLRLEQEGKLLIGIFVRHPLIFGVSS